MRWPPPGEPRVGSGQRQERPLENGVGPGPTAKSSTPASSGSNPAAATRSTSRPNPSDEPGGVGRAGQAHRPPPHHRHSQARGEHQVPVAVVAAEVEHAAHLAAGDAAPARDRVGQVVAVPRAVRKTSRTWLARPECVSSASTGPLGCRRARWG